MAAWVNPSGGSEVYSGHTASGNEVIFIATSAGSTATIRLPFRVLVLRAHARHAENSPPSKASTAATSKVLGDQTPPGPSNGGGGAVDMAGNPADTTETAPDAVSTATNARTLDQPGEPGVTTGKPAAFQAAIPPPMCAAWRCPAARRCSAAVNDRLPLPQ